MTRPEIDGGLGGGRSKINKRAYWREIKYRPYKKNMIMHEALHSATVKLLSRFTIDTMIDFYVPDLQNIDGSLTSARTYTGPAPQFKWQRAAITMAPILINDIAWGDEQKLSEYSPSSRKQARDWLFEHRDQLMNIASHTAKHIKKKKPAITIRRFKF